MSQTSLFILDHKCQAKTQEQQEKIRTHGKQKSLPVRRGNPPVRSCSPIGLIALMSQVDTARR